MVTELMNEVRIKLNVHQQQQQQQNLLKDQYDVKQLWMCLNYTQKPTIAHIIDHVRRYLCQNEYELPLYNNNNNSDKKMMNDFDVKLFLDDYWLPPSENSRLLRENDCIK
jgi:hypothetical protein